MPAYKVTRLVVQREVNRRARRLRAVVQPPGAGCACGSQAFVRVSRLSQLPSSRCRRFLRDPISRSRYAAHATYLMTSPLKIYDPATESASTLDNGHHPPNSQDCQASQKLDTLVIETRTLRTLFGYGRTCEAYALPLCQVPAKQIAQLSSTRLLRASA